MLYPIPKSHLKANPQYLKYKINIVHLMFRWWGAFSSKNFQIHNNFSNFRCFKLLAVKRPNRPLRYIWCLLFCISQYTYINNNSYFQLVTFIISFITHQKIILCGRGLDYVVPNLTSSRRLKHFCHKAELSPFSPFSSNCFLQIHPNLCTFNFILTFHFHLFFTSPPIVFFRLIPASALSLSFLLFSSLFYFHLFQIAFCRFILTCALSLSFSLFHFYLFHQSPNCFLQIHPNLCTRHSPTFILCMKCIQET